MQVGKLDHVNVKTANLEAMVAWYGDVLGMTSGKRPDFSFPGAWLYAGEEAVVHLVGIKSPMSAIDPAIEHYAFSASGLPGFVDRLTARGIAHSLDKVPGFDIVQVNLHDCDGNHIHVDFHSDEAAGLIENRADFDFASIGQRGVMGRRIVEFRANRLLGSTKPDPRLLATKGLNSGIKLPLEKRKSRSALRAHRPSKKRHLGRRERDKTLGLTCPPRLPRS